MQSYLYGKGMDKSGFPNASKYADLGKKPSRESINNVFRSHIDKTRKEILEDKMKVKKRVFEQVEQIVSD